MTRIQELKKEIRRCQKNASALRISQARRSNLGYFRVRPELWDGEACRLKGELRLEIEARNSLTR